MSNWARSVEILAAFRPSDRALTAAELARRTGMARSSAYRLVAELAAVGVLDHAEDGNYRLGMKLFEFGQLALHQRGLRESASSFLADLSTGTRQAVHLAILDDFEVVYLDIIRPSPSPYLRSRIGGRLPATVTGVGKAILAFSPPEMVDQVIAHGLVALTPHSIVDEARLRAELAKTRRTGLAYDHQESAIGTSCCAAPILGEAQHAVGAVSVSGHTNRIRLDLVAAAVQTTAASISRVQYARVSN